MYGSELDSMENIEDSTGKRLVVRAMGHYHMQKYEVYSR